MKNRIAAEVNRNRSFDGIYVRGTVNENGDLVWKLTDEGLEGLADLRAVMDVDDDTLFAELIEDITAGCAEFIRPEEVGALTDGMLISDDCERNDCGDLAGIGRIWWDNQYQVRSTVGELEKGNEVVWAAGHG